MRSPQQRTHCQDNEMLGLSNATRQCAALSGVRIAKQTKSLGNRMQQDNARPSAAYTLPRQRNAWAIECNKTMRSPQRCTHCQENEITRECKKTMRSPQRRTHCQENEITGQSATRQCAALSGAHIAKKTWAIGRNKTMRSPQPRTHYETSFPMRIATVNTLQPHQILRLPRKMNLRIAPRHI